MKETLIHDVVLLLSLSKSDIRRPLFHHSFVCQNVCSWLVGLLVFSAKTLRFTQCWIRMEWTGLEFAEGSGEQGKIEETGGEIICGAPTTLAVKG